MEASYVDEQSPYAAEGTLAHALAEKTLRRYLNSGKLNFTATDNKKYEQEMLDNVMQYCECCVERIIKARKEDAAASVLIEERLDFSEFVPEGFGTGDLVLIYSGCIEIIDLKYGKGVEVSAVDNPQMRLYALGAYTAYDILYDVDRVITTIYQPRINNISTDEITAIDLMEWAHAIKPIAMKAFAGEGECNAGPHCKFCKARYNCKANAEYHTQTYSKYGTTSKDELSEADVSKILMLADDAIKWFKGLQEYALTEMLNGSKEWPGMKIVEGRSLRKIEDVDGAISALREYGLEDDVIFKPEEINTITTLEKAMGKKAFNEVLNDFIVKPPGKPTLVSIDDKRPAMDFKNVKDTFNDDLLED